MPARTATGQGEVGSAAAALQETSDVTLQRDAPCEARVISRDPPRTLTSERTRPRTQGAMDRFALERELEALHVQSFAWALVCCGHHRADAEDALQTVYLRILDGEARFEARSTFRTWLFGVIRRCAAQQRRRRWWAGPFRNGGPHEGRPDPRPGADQVIEQDERAARLMAALRALPRRQQEVLELVFYHEMTIAEAGEVIGVSIGTARTHYERGKKSMSRLLSGERGP